MKTEVKRASLNMSKHEHLLLCHLEEWPKQIRERLKSQNKAECNKKPTPLVVKPSSQLQHHGVLSAFGNFHDVSSAAELKSSVVGKMIHVPALKVLPAKRSPSPPTSHSKTKSILPANDSIGHNLRKGETLIKMEHLKEKLNLMKMTRLYLIRRPGPRSFLVASDVPQQTYRVTVGTQECSCGKSPHCIHVLFIMLRVLRVKENDMLLRNGSLKNYEVESLIAGYEERQQKWIQYKKKLMKKNFHSSTQCLNKLTNTLSIKMRPQSMPDIRSSQAEEEDRCPICLNAMNDGDISVMCKSGCRNRLHQKCFGFWAAECKRQQEPVNCPLCRAIWSSLDHFNCPTADNREYMSKSAQPSGTSSLPLSLDGKLCSAPVFSSLLSSLEDGLPSRCLAPPEKKDVPKCSQVQYLRCHQGKFARWREVYGIEMVNNLISCDWVIRERGLNDLHVEVTSVLSRLAKDHVVLSKHLQMVVSLSFEIITVLAADPVFRVYVACLRCFRSLLTYTVCRTKTDGHSLRKHVRPFIKAILIKCVDGNRKVNRLSKATILELCKGSAGEFCVGKHTGQPDHVGIGGISFLLNCMLEPNGELDDCSWQWWLGRLQLLDHLMEEFPCEFYLLHVQMYSREVGCELAARGNKLVHLDRLMSILNFAVKLMNHYHLNVKRMARRVFVLAARLTAHVPPVFLKVCDMLIMVDSGLEIKLKEQLQMNAQFSIPSEVLQQVQKASAVDETIVYTSVLHSGRRRTWHTRSSPFVGHSLILEKLGPDVPYRNRFSSAFSECNGFYHLKQHSLGYHGTSKTKSFHFRQFKRAASSLDPLVFTGRGGFPLDLDLCNQLEERSCRPTKPQCLWTLSEQQFLANQVANKQGGHVDSAFSKDCCYCHCRQNYARNEINTKCISASANVNCPVGNLIDLSSSPTVIPSTPFWEDNATEKFTIDCLVNNANPSASGESTINPKSSYWTEDKSSSQSSLPIIPGLTNMSFEVDNSTGTYTAENVKMGESLAYLEGTQWIRGQLLGTGAFSSCYQARDVMTGTLMAVKQVSFCRNAVDEQEAQMLAIRDEIIMMMKLDHPNIVRLLGATLQGNHYNMFVEWMPGGSVATLLNSYGSFVEAVILHYIKQVLSGLAFLHENQILHRDLKGANLLVDSTGQHLRIGDFGAAARMASHRTIADEFKGQLLGTIAFMAPEVLRGEGYGRSCDIWSVGCVVLEMATAKPPWDAANISNDLALLYKIACAKDPPPIPLTLSPVVRAVALRCLQPKSEDRPPAKKLLRDSCFIFHC